MVYTDTQIGVDDIDGTIINIGDAYIKIKIGGNLLSDALSLTFINKSKTTINNILNKNSLNTLDTNINITDEIGTLNDHINFKKRIENTNTEIYNKILFKWFKLGEIYISPFKMIYFTLIKIYENEITKRENNNTDNNKKFNYNKEFIDDMKTINIIL